MVWSAPTGVFGTLQVWDDPPPFCSVHMLSLGIGLIEISDIYRPAQRWGRINYATGRDGEEKKKKTDSLGWGVQGCAHIIWYPQRMQLRCCKWKKQTKNTLKVAIILSFSGLNVQIRQVHFFKHRLQFWAFYLTSNRMHWLQSSIKEWCFKSTRFLPFWFIIILTFVKVLLRSKAAEAVNLHVWTFALKPFLCS